MGFFKKEVVGAVVVAKLLELISLRVSLRTNPGLLGAVTGYASIEFSRLRPYLLGGEFVFNELLLGSIVDAIFFCDYF